jgi:hypothetical protein
MAKAKRTIEIFENEFSGPNFKTIAYEVVVVNPNNPYADIDLGWYETKEKAEEVMAIAKTKYRIK